MLRKKKKKFDRFKQYRNLLDKLIKKSKQNHYTKYFSDNVNNLRDTWKGINSIIQTKNKTGSTPNCIIGKNVSITDPAQIDEK